MKSFVLAVFGVIFFGGFGILCFVWAVVTLGRGEYVTAIVVLGFAAFCFGLIVSSVLVRTGRVAPRVVFDAAGTTIRRDRAVAVLIPVWAFGGVVAMGMFAILWPLGKLDIPVPQQMRYAIPFMSAAGAVTGLPMLWQMVSRRGTNYLRLTPDGFEFAQGSSSPRGEWARVKDVTDRVPGKPVPAYSAIVIVMSDKQTHILSATSYTPHGHALRELVRFYWQHPERRTELTDGRALERLRDEEFEVER